MKINEETVLVGSKVILVPYRKEHVERYHQWMSDPQIREQTASEPLSIEEEYEMQRSWHLDDDKLTFIILGRGQDDDDRLYSDIGALLSTATMAGDVNLFFSERHLDDEAENGGTCPQKVYDAELEVMIAESTQRRRGLAQEALRLIVYYASASPTPTAQDRRDPLERHALLPLPVDAFVAKVGLSNRPSIRLFEQLGFKEVKRSEIWKEAELRPDVKKGLTPLAPSAVLRWPLTR